METKTRRNSTQPATSARAKDQQGFAAAWREGTHAFRGKAVLSFFLAFLLCTAQPSGYSLYKAWGGTDDSLAGAFQAAAADDDLTVGVAQLTAQAVKQGVALQADEIAPPDGIAKTYNNTITYYADGRTDTEVLNYAVDQLKEDGSPKQVTNSETPNVASTNVTIAEFKTGNDWVAITDPDENTVIDLSTVANPSIGNFGVPTKSSVPVTFDANTEVSLPIWVFGMKFLSWSVPQVESLADNKKNRVPTTIAATKTSGLSYRNGEVLYTLVPVWDRVSVSENRKVAELGGGDRQGSNYADRRAYGQWAVHNGYTVRFMVNLKTGGNAATVANSGDTYYKPIATAIPGLGWTDEFTVVPSGLGFNKTTVNAYKLFTEIMSTDAVYWASVKKDGTLSGNGFWGSTGTVGEAANSSMNTTAEYDPYYADTVYNQPSSGAANGTGVITVVPAVGIQYKAGAGTINGETYPATGGSADMFEAQFTAGDKDLTLKSAPVSNNQKADGLYGKVTDSEGNAYQYTIPTFDDANITKPVVPDGYTVYPLKEGDKFVYLDQNGNKHYSGDPYGETGKMVAAKSGEVGSSPSLELTAQWVITKDEGSKSITLDYKPSGVGVSGYNGHKSGSALQEELIDNAETGQSLPAGALDGYVFIGWSKSLVTPGTATANQRSSYFTEIPAEFEDEAVFHAVYGALRTVSFKSADTSMGTVTAPATTLQLEQATGLTAARADFDSLADTARMATAVPASNDYSFDGWTVESTSAQDTHFSGSSNEQLVVTKGDLNTNKSSGSYADTTFVANFVRNYSVTFSVDGGTLGTATTPITKVKSGYEITSDNVPAATTPNESGGYKLPVTWYKKVGGAETELPDGPEGETITADTEFIARYTATNPVATFDLDGSYKQEGTQGGLKLSGTLTQQVTYGSAVNASAAPTLVVPDDLKAKYTGALDASEPWSPSLSTLLTADQTFLAKPELRTYTVVVNVQGGKFSDNTTQKTYSNVAYGTSASDITGLTADVAAITASAGYSKTGATWSGGGQTGTDPTEGTTLVDPATQGTGTVTYTYTLKESKPVATFKLASSVTDAQLAGTTAVGQEVKHTLSGYNAQIGQGNVPGLQGGYDTQKYTGDIAWVKDGDDSVTYTTAEVGAMKLKADAEFVGTPTLKDVTITYVVSGGTWADGSAANKTSTVKYGSPITGYPTNMKADGNHVQASGTWGNNAGDNPADVSSFAGAKTTFTYTFGSKVTDTFKIVGGKWANGSDTITESGVTGDTYTTPDTTTVSANSGYATVGTWDSEPAGTLGATSATYTYTLKTARTVTLKIEGGTWSDDSTADKTEIVANGGSLVASQVPTGMKAATGYGPDGAWYNGATRVDDPTSLAISAATTLTYKFDKGSTTYKVRVHKQKLGTGNTVLDEYDVTEVSGSDTTGGNVTVAEAKTLAGVSSVPEGFAVSAVHASSSDAITLDGDPANNVFDFYYDRQTYTLTYTMGYKDSAADIPADAVAPVDTVQYYYEAPVTVLAEPTTSVTGASGYKFDGWYLNSGSTEYNKDDSFNMPAQNSTLSGTWSRDEVTITFELKTPQTLGNIDTDNYTGASETRRNEKLVVKARVGDTVKFPGVTTETDGYFKNWTTGPSSDTDGVVASTADFAATTTATYYAWFAAKVTVSYGPDAKGIGAFKAQSNKFATIVDDKTVAVTLPGPETVVDSSTSEGTPNNAADSKHAPGYEFKGWVGGDVTTAAMGKDNDALVTYLGQFSANTFKSYEFTAVYEGIPHKVYLDLTGGGTLDNSYTALKSGSSNTTDYKTGEYVALPSTSQLTRDGYNLTGFTIAEAARTTGEDIKVATYADGTAGGTFQVKAEDNATDVVIVVTPRWEAKTHNVTYKYEANYGSPTFPTLPAKVDNFPYGTSFKVAYTPAIAASGVTWSDSAVVDPENSAPNGYTWKGWTAKTSQGTTVTIDGSGAFDMPDADVVITGTYEINTYKVTYKLAESYDGATLSGGDNNENVRWGTSASSLTNGVTLDTYDSAKWKSTITWAPSSETESHLVDGKIVGDVDFVGTLEPATYTVRLVVKGGTFNGANATGSGVVIAEDVPYGTKVDAANFQQLIDFSNPPSSGAGTEAKWNTIVELIKPTGDNVAVGWVGGDPTKTGSDAIEITGNRTFTYEYKAARTVKFQVNHGTWTNNGASELGDNNTTITIKVPDGTAIPTAWISALDASSGANKPVPAEGYDSATGAWVGGAPDDTTPITADATYTYSYDPKSYPYKIVKHYQSIANADSYPASDDVTITENLSAPYGTVITAAAVKAANADNYNAKKDGFTNIHQNKAGAQSDSQITIAVSDDGSANVLNFYFDRETYTISYQWEGAAPGTAKLPDDVVVRHGATNVQVANGYKLADNSYSQADIAGNSFSGWYRDTDMQKANKLDGTTITGPIEEDYTLKGSWDTAKYPVTYKVSRDLDQTTWDTAASITTNAVAEGTFQLKLDSTTAASVTGTTTHGSVADNPETVITAESVANPMGGAAAAGTEQFEFAYWSYNKSGSQDSTADTTLDPGVSPSSITIDQAGYVFTAHFKLKTFTVSYTAGSHGKALTPTPGQIVFSGVKYGEETPVPTADNIDANGGSGGKVQVLDSDKNGFQLVSDEWFWDPAKEDRVYKAETYAAKFEPKTYDVTFLNYTGSTLADVSGFTGTNANLQWSESIFKDLDAAKAPTKSGYTFAGWHASQQTPNENTGVGIQSGTLADNTTVSSLFAASSVFNPDKTLYVWAEWSNNPATLTYNSNYDTNVAVEKTGYEVTSKPALLSAAALSADNVAFTRQGYELVGWSTDNTTTAANFDATTPEDYKVGDKITLSIDTTTSPNTTNVYAVWKAKEYTVQWRDGDGNIITDGTNPIIHKVTYGDTSSYTLPAMVQSSPARPAPPTADPTAVFQKWTVDADGAQVDDAATLTEDQLRASEGSNNVITLTPRWAGKVKLSFNDGVATEAINVPVDMQEPKGNAGDATKAQFTLSSSTANMMPTRQGYTFTGWKIGGEDAIMPTAEGVTVDLEDDATAVAQWEAGMSPYTVQRFFETGFGTNEYPDEPNETITLYGPTDSTGTLTGKVSAAQDAETYTVPQNVEGYDLTTPTSAAGWTCTILADESGAIKMYYRVKSYTITHAFTGIEPEDAASVTAELAKLTATVYTGAEFTFSDPADYIPEGYEKADADQSGSWQYTVKNGDTSATGDATKIDKVTGNSVVTYPLKKKSFTVTYEVEPAYGKWAGKTDAAADAQSPRTESNVKWGTTPQMTDDQGDEVQATYLDSTLENGTTVTYALAGWAVKRSDGSYDGNDLVQPTGYQVKADTTFIAVYKKIHVVSYLPGDHSLAGFKGLNGTDENKTLFTGLGEQTAGKYAAADAQLVLSDDEWASEGVPAAEPGYEFLGWAVNWDPSIQQTPTYSRTLPLLDQGNDADYVFTAIWGETTQSVTFEPGANAAAGATAQTISGKTGSSWNSPAALAAAKYYAFVNWLRTDAVDVASPASLGTNVAFTIPAKDGVVYTAQYTPTTVDLKYQSDNEAQGVVDHASDLNVPQNDEPDKYGVVAKPKAGYQFDHWEISGIDDTSGWDLTQETLDIQQVKDDDDDYVYQALTATAYFKPIEPQVTFVLDSATKDLGTLNVKYKDDAGYQAVDYDGYARTGGEESADEFVRWQANDGYEVAEWTYVMQESRDDGDVKEVKGSGVLNPNTVQIKGDTVFTLKFKAGSTTLEFDGNGATGGYTAGITGTTGETEKLPANGYKKPGFEFVGWALDSDATTADYKVDDDFVMGSAKKLYAIWKAEPVKIEYNSNYITGSTAANTKETVSTEYGTDAKAATLASLSIDTVGYTRANGVAVPPEAVEFLGWSTDENDVAPMYEAGDTIPGAMLAIASDEPLKLYGVWADKKFKVTFNGNGATKRLDQATYEEMPTISGVVYGETVNIPQNQYDRVNYHFLHWNITPPAGTTTQAGDSAGNPTSFTFLQTQDALVSPEWGLNPGASANMKVLYFDDDNGPMTPASREGQSTSDQPMVSYVVPDRTPHIVFDGWYAAIDRTDAQKLAGTETIEGILAKYYDASVTDTYLNTPYWSNSDFAAGYAEGNGVEVKLYASYTMTGYTVHFDPNAPDGYTASDVAAMPDQEFTVGTAQQVSANTFAFPGYKFLGWVNGTAPAKAVMTQAEYDALANKVAVDYTTAPELVDTDSLTAETTLYAAWEAVENTVTFMNRFEGDGLLGENHEYDKTMALKWNDPIVLTYDGGNPSSYGEPYDDYVFVGWYGAVVSSYDPNLVRADAVPVTLNTSRLGAVVKALQAKKIDVGYKESDGSYNIVLYALYAKDGIRIVYHTGASSYGEPPAERTLQVGDSPSPVTLATNALHKYGYIANGWTTVSPSEVTGERAWNVTNSSFMRNAVDEEGSSGTLNAGGDVYTPIANQRVDVDLYPAYEPRFYTVNYDYETVDGYSGDYKDLKKAQYEADESMHEIDQYAGGSGNVQWLTNNLVGYGFPDAEAPELPGYSFGGWYVDSDRTIGVNPLTTYGDVVDSLNGSDETMTSITLYAQWDPESYKVSYELNGGTYDGDNSLDPKSDVAYATRYTGDDTLVPDSANLANAGYAEGSWFIDYDTSVAVPYKAGGYTYAELYDLWKTVPGNANQPAPSEITLYAGYTQDTVTITYRVGDAAHSSLATAGGQALAEGTTKLVVKAGAADGVITEVTASYKSSEDAEIAFPAGATLSTYEVVASSDAGYESGGWTPPQSDGNDPAYTGDTGISLNKLGGQDAYADGTYVYGTSSGTTTYKVNYYHEKADEDGYELVSDQDHEDAVVGATITPTSPDNLVLPQTGFTFNPDESTTSIVLGANEQDNVLNLRYDRNRHDVVFVGYEWEGGISGGAALPDDRTNQKYGSTQAMTDPDEVEGFEFDGWYASDENGNRTDTKVARSFAMPDENVYVVGVWTKAAEPTYEVNFTGVFDEQGNEVNSAQIRKMAGYVFPITVVSGNSVADTDADFNVQLQDASKSEAEDPDAEVVVSYNSSLQYVSWYYEDANGDTIVTTDPANEPIYADTVFRAVVTTTPPAVTSSLLAFDLNTEDKDGNDLHQRAEWSADALAKHFDEQTRYNANSVVTLPSAEEATCDGYTLKAWVFTTTDDEGVASEKRYEPGTASFRMPVGEEDEVFTLVAEWEEDPVVITYKSEGDGGSVLGTSDEGTAWSLDPAGSEPVADAGYEFVGWALEDGTPVTDGVDAAGKLVPEPAGENGKWVDITYVATFQGRPCEVTFASEDRAMGILVDEDGEEVGESFYRTSIRFDSKPTAELMAGLVATPNRGYLIDGPEYWTYETRDLETGNLVESGQTDNPTKVTIKGNTAFVAHFKANDLDYLVKYDVNGVDYDPQGNEVTPVAASDSRFADKTVNWNSVGLGNNAAGEELVPVKTGYEFLGWFAEDSDERLNEERDAYSGIAEDESTEFITLHAHWQMKSPYTLYFEPNGGSDAQAVGQNNVNKLQDLWWNTPVNGSDEQFQMGDTARNGYDFLGWFSAETGGSLVIGPLGGSPASVPYSTIANGNDSPMANVTVWAHWDEKSYTVDYLDGDDVAATATVPYTGSAQHDSLADKPASLFKKWVFEGADGELFDLDDYPTLEAMIEQGAEPAEDGHYKVLSQWTDLFQVKTTYVPYLYNEETGEYDKVEGTDWYERFPDNLVKTEAFEEGGTAQAYQLTHPAYKVPGFMYDVEQARLADPTFSEDALTVANATGDVEFFIPVIARLDVGKHEYKVHYEMNDDEVFPGGQLPSNDEYADKVQKSFANDDNIPTDDNKVPLVPTRPGFRFDKWVNSLEWANTDAGYMEPAESTLYGDLAVRQDGTWYDPEDDPDFPGVVNIYAKWNEKQHKVLYQVSAERPGGEIRLNADSDPDFSGDQREETIGAATGETSPDVLAVGAIAQAKRGYTFDRWTVYSAKGDTITDVLSNRSPMVMSAAEEISLAVQSVAPAAVKAAPGMTAQAETTSEYSTNAAIMPGVNGAGLFAGLDEDPEDGESDDVVYTAEFSQNPMAKVTFDKGDSDEYTGPEGYEQPEGTYVGESGDPDWGDNPGQLPGSDTLKRDGYTFKGWKDKATGTVYDPDSDDAKSIVVPEGGIEFEPVWEKNAEPEKTTAQVTVDDVTLPDGTVVKGYDLSKSIGSKLTDDEISKMIDRGGYTPDKWTVTHLNDDGTVKSTTTMTTAELQEYFKNNAVTDDIIVSVPGDAKWTKNTSTKPASPSPTVTRSASPKTGDAPYLLVAGSTAIVAAAALLVLLVLRKRREEE